MKSASGSGWQFVLSDGQFLCPILRSHPSDHGLYVFVHGGPVPPATRMKRQATILPVCYTLCASCKCTSLLHSKHITENHTWPMCLTVKNWFILGHISYISGTLCLKSAQQLLRPVHHTISTSYLRDIVAMYTHTRTEKYCTMQYSRNVNIRHRENSWVC